MNTPRPVRETVEQLAEEFAERHRRGEHPSISEYAARHPEQAKAIRELFPAVVMMERIAPNVESEASAPTAPGPPPHIVEVPRRLGDYRILREIGRGGMGVVYEAEQLSLGRHVALKLLPPHFRPSPEQRQRFEREARAAARLHHTNIVPVFGVGEEGGLHYYVMQYIRGLGLEAVMRELGRLGPGSHPAGSVPAPSPGLGAASLPDMSAEAMARSLVPRAFDRENGAGERLTEHRAAEDGHHDTTGVTPPAGAPPAAARSDGSVVLPGQGDDGGTSRGWTYWHSVAQLGSQVADALDYAHERGILHRDIKPANLLLDTRGNVWVTDFGLAKLDDEDTLTKTGDVIGTARYLAPEMLEGEADARSDVYALGLTLFELLAFRPAFDESVRPRLVRQIMAGVPTRLERLNPKIPRDLATIIHKAIDRDPRGRYQTARQLAEDLRRFLEDRPILARRPSSFERLVRWSRRNRSLAGALATIAALLVTGTVASALAAVHFRRLAAEAERGRLRASRATAGERRARYHSNIAAAAGALLLQNIGPARLALGEAPEEYRNWEWRHLLSQLEGARLVMTLPSANLEWPLFVAGPSGGEVAVAYREDNRIGVWDTTTGMESLRWCGPLAPREVFAYSPDRKRLATGSERHDVQIWDVATGTPLARLAAQRGAIWSVTFGPDARRIVTSGEDGSFRLWDATTGRSLAALGSNGGDRLLPALYSPDGMWIATACEKDMRLWDGNSGRPLGLLGRHGHPLSNMAIVSDGRRVASTAHDEKEVVLWDPATRTRVATLTGHTERTSWFVASPVGSRIISDDWNFRDPAPRLWDTATGRLVRVMSGHTNIVQPKAVAFSPDGTRVVTGSLDQSALLWDSLTGERIAAMRGHTGILWGARFSPDSKLVVTMSDDQTMRLWQARDGAPLAVLRGHAGRVWDAVFTAAGQLVSASGDDTLRVWDINQVRDGILRGHERYVYDAAFNGEGSIVASAAWDHTVRLWDARSGRQLGDPLRHESQVVTSLAFSPDGRRLAVVTRDDRIHVWDVGGRKRLHVLPCPTGDWVGDCRLAFSPDGTLLAGGAWDGAVRLWDVVTGAPVGTLQGPEVHIYDLAFSPDGRRLATAGERGPVRLLDVATRQSFGELAGLSATIPRLTYSGDGQLIAWAAAGDTVKVSDTGTDRELASLYIGSVIYGMAFSPDRTRLAIACKDNTIRLWDLHSYQQVVELRGHTDYVHSVAFSPDGTQLVSASGDTTVRIWDSLPPQRRADHGRNHAHTEDLPAEQMDGPGKNSAGLRGNRSSVRIN